MTNTHVELGPQTGAFTAPSATRCEWPVEPGRTTSLRTSLGWDLRELGTPAPAAKDLLRIVAGAYVTDRARRPPGATVVRDLRVTVHLEQPETWTTPVLETLADLLHWLTGDDWALRCVPAATAVPRPSGLPLAVTAADDVCLLSGGLDSYCGALLRHQQPGIPLFLGHADTATAVRRAQDALSAQLAGLMPARTYVQHRLHPDRRGNSTPKTRSLLFMALAVTAASGFGADRVLVPENGFTSINPPLEPSRAGVMTTRSTHPWTFHQLRLLLNQVGLGSVAVLNPHAQLTKGELVYAALHSDPTALATASKTVSCAKLNAGRPPGGNANLQCGACIACQVRRAAFYGAGLADPTNYAVTGPDQALAATVRHHRRHDLAAVQTATQVGIAEHRILGNALWPPDIDFDAVLDLCGRGLRELSLVPA